MQSTKSRSTRGGSAARARDLAPLLEAIGREIQERTDRLAVLEEELARLSRRVRRHRGLIQVFTAEAAQHRRGLRHAEEELRYLGCALVGTSPPRFQIDSPLHSVI